MTSEALERFVDADEAAAFLSITRRRILDLARAGKLPAHPIGDGAKRVWRFRLSEIAAAVASTTKPWFSSRRRTSMVRPTAVPGAIGTEG
jgi:excisionase family DNA binding protein